MAKPASYSALTMGGQRKSTKCPRRNLPYKLIATTCLAQLVFLWLFFIRKKGAPTPLEKHYLHQFHGSLNRCAELARPPIQYSQCLGCRTSNSRWNTQSGQDRTVVLKNVTLFDGEAYFSGPADVMFSKGLIVSVSSSGALPLMADVTDILDLGGKYVTPGIVDMHSHHLVGAWPDLKATEDGNEMHSDFGPLTPFVRSLDSMKPYDLATDVIRSGGVTTSLILPGSANIMGGEAFIVKNIVGSGEDGEQVVEDMLLERGVPKEERRRYMKMACGENPRRVYHHTRMGNAWIFRKHMARAVELKEKQDAWCAAAAQLSENRDWNAIREFMTDSKGLPEEMELESTVAILRGKVGVNIHCYEPEDFEDMLRHSEEFGFRIQAFHHALSAWKVPEMIKKSGQNITIATFSDFGLYKKEAYEANLYAGKILAEHGVPVAYKSDHAEEGTLAKYVLYEAAMAHSYGLPEIKALQAITSVPAKSLEQDHRVGYIKVGHDADIVVWNAHPLAIGTTPLQVYVDGKPTLDSKAVEKSMRGSKVKTEFDISRQTFVRPQKEEHERARLCEGIESGSPIMITGISKSLLPESIAKVTGSVMENMTAVVDKGRITCLGDCSSVKSAQTFHLQHGQVAPGLVSISRSLGMLEIGMEKPTQDGFISPKMDVENPENVIFAKYGVHLEGRAFERARIGGVTRSISIPLMDGFLGGVSVGIRTSGRQSLLNGGVFESETGLHFAIEQDAKGTRDTPSISLAVSKLRTILKENVDKENVFGSAVNGSLPLVVHAENKYDIQQLILVKKDFSSINLIIYGGAEAPAVRLQLIELQETFTDTAQLAMEIANAQIPIILTHNRGGPSKFETKGLLVGPPLTPSAVSVLVDANVTVALARDDPEGDSSIHALALEAGWAFKYARLSEQEAISLVSSKVLSIFGLEKSENPDLVFWENDPLEFGASVSLAVDGGTGEVLTCWPVSN